MSLRNPRGWCLPSAPGNSYRHPVVIGLVNNMPDAALQSTEEQFRGLLADAAHGLEISLRFFYLPEIPRSQAGRSHLITHCSEIVDLWTSDVDGLIVTGTEPQSPVLSAEPYWSTFTRLVDWAENHRIPTIWSCLAAHCAVQYMDGIRRDALGKKLFGVFECTKAGHHPVLDHCPSTLCIPHSRYNDVPEEALVLAGYQILTRSPDTGADIFLKNCATRHLFLQGHPEYDAGALAREYRRDVKRFLLGRRDSYPDMPSGYFATDVAAVLQVLRQRALKNRTIELLSQFPAALIANAPAPWRRAAVAIYRNWLSHLLAQKSVDLGLTESRGLRSHAYLELNPNQR